MAASTRAILVQTDRLVIALVDCVAYSTGFEFAIAFRTKAEDNRLRNLFGPPESQGGDRFQLTIRYPGGASRSVGSRPTPEAMEYYRAAQEGREPASPTGPVVMQRSGSASDSRADFRYWCWPLPPEGEMIVSLKWSAGGVQDANAKVDGTAIHRAGMGSQPLWR